VEALESQVRRPQASPERVHNSPVNKEGHPEPYDHQVISPTQTVRAKRRDSDTETESEGEDGSIKRQRRTEPRMASAATASHSKQN